MADVKHIEKLFGKTKEEFNDEVKSFTSAEKTELLLNLWDFYDRFILLETSFLMSSVKVPKVMEKQFMKLMGTKAFGGEQIYRWLCKCCKCDSLYGVVEEDKHNEKTKS